MTLLSILAYVVAYGALALVILGAIGIFAWVGSGLLSLLLMEWERRDELAARERRPWRR